MPTDYRPSVFLPKTDFPMRGDLPKREPLMLVRWEGMDLYRRLRETSRGREKCRTGPPRTRRRGPVLAVFAVFCSESTAMSTPPLGRISAIRFQASGWLVGGLAK